MACWRTEVISILRTNRGRLIRVPITIRGRSSPNGIYHSLEVARQPIAIQKIKMIGIELRHKRCFVVVFTEDSAIDMLEL